jgi:DNA-3-methyladenine glycosylase II
MWFPDAPPDDRWHDAIAFLRRDRVLAPIIDRVGPCTLRPRRDYFVKLVQSILSQQVSVKAAAAMYVKLARQFPRKRVTPERLAAFLRDGDEDTIRSCGLSRQKRSYLLDLSTRFADGSIPHRRFVRMSDEEIVATLTAIKGIGKWTVEMLLIFALNRPDVWPADDLGLREALHRLYPRRYPERPTAKQVLDAADAWRPWRSIATWYLWRDLEG